jgi:quercetin dioxygenase-like cupin family protein
MDEGDRRAASAPQCPGHEGVAGDRRAHLGDFRWDEVALLAYKDPGDAPFRDVTRQVLFERDDLGCQLRYFEVAAGGHSTLERHQHVHGVVVLRGRGRALVGSAIHALEAHDLIEVPPMTWHQFRADAGEPLGFLCMVNRERDRPQLPTGTQLAELRRDPAVGAFIRV